MKKRNEKRRKTIHVPKEIHVKLMRIKRKLKRPLTHLIDRMADATMEAMREESETRRLVDVD